MCEWLVKWVDIAHWLEALGTILVAIAAVFQARIEGWWHQPELILERGKIPFIHDVDPENNRDRILVLLSVINKNGLADKAEVFLESVNSTVGSKNILLEHIVPTSLRWAHREAGSSEVFVTISRGMRRYFILGALKTRDDRSVYFHFWSETKYAPQSDEVSAGNYAVTLSVGSSNMEPKVKEVLLVIPSNFEKPHLQIT